MFRGFRAPQFSFLQSHQRSPSYVRSAGQRLLSQSGGLPELPNTLADGLPPQSR